MLRASIEFHMEDLWQRNHGCEADQSQNRLQVYLQADQSDMNLIEDAFKGYDGPFDTEFKYARARMFSSERPTWFDKIYRDEVVAHKVKVWMNVRNDDIFTFRWGNPGYANNFIKNMPAADVMAGY